MTARPYYSARTGSDSVVAAPDLSLVRELFVSLFKNFETRGYFQQALGYVCVDLFNPVAGTVGEDIEAYFFQKLRKKDLWPIHERAGEYTENDVFDVIELLHDLVSKPLDGTFHQFSDCGWHYEKFDAGDGREEYRSEVNTLIRDYSKGYDLSAEGEVITLGNRNLHQLLSEHLPEQDPQNVGARVEVAVAKFRRRAASLDDRRAAVRDLADVLEFLRPQLSAVLTKKDESDLFNITNNFGIRHHNLKQRTRYDAEIWLECLFYHYLNIINTTERLLARRDDSD